MGGTMRLFAFSSCDDFGCIECNLELGVFKSFALASFTFSIDPEPACFVVSLSLRPFPKSSLIDAWIDIGLISCYLEILKPLRRFRA